METPFCTIAPQFPGEVGKPGKLSTWVLDGDGIKADVDLDFVNNRGWQGRIAPLASLVTCTRSISGTGHVYDYADDVNGVWYPFLANVPRITNKGLLVEEQRTNSNKTSNPLDTSALAYIRPAIDASSDPITYGAEPMDGDELLTNSEFVGDLTGWTYTPSGGSSFVWQSNGDILLTWDGTNQAYLDQSFTTIPGHMYTVRIGCISISTMSPRLHLGTAQGGTQYINNRAYPAGASYFQFIATTGTAWIRMFSAGSSGSAHIKSVSAQIGGIPINWVLGGSNTGHDLDLFHKVVAVGFDDAIGFPYIRCRYYGTSGSGSGTLSFHFAEGGEITAANGQTWAGSLFNRLVSGSKTGFNSLALFPFATASGSGTALSGTTSTALTLDSTWSRDKRVQTLNNSSAGGFVLSMEHTTSASQNIDITYDLAVPQSENCNINATVASATINNGGSGGTNGAQVVTVSGGTGTAATLNVTISGGAITAINGVAVAGSYSTIPGSTGVSVTGASLSGASVNLVYTNNSTQGFCTSPIVTKTSAVTRNYDLVNIGLPLGSAYSYVFKGVTNEWGASTGAIRAACAINDGSVNNMIGWAYYQSLGEGRFRCLSGNTNYASISSAIPSAGTVFSVAQAIDASSTYGALNGTLTAIDNSVTLPVSPNKLTVGSYYNYYPINGYVKRISAWGGNKLSQAELQRLTT